MTRLLLLLSLGVFGCHKHVKAEASPIQSAPLSWQRDSVTIDATGYVIAQNQQRPARWKTAGVFVTGDLIATRATHILRATKLSSVTMSGTRHEITEVAALDLERDIALLRTSTRRPGPERVLLRARPKDPRALRRVAVEAVGVTPDGLARYPGHIVNVTREPEFLYHDGQVPRDLDNGPVLSTPDGELLGLQRRVQPEFRFSQVLPLWSLKEMMDGVGEGISPEVLFRLPTTATLRRGQAHEICVEAGEAHEFHAPFSLGEDLVVRLRPKPGHRLYYELAVLARRGTAPLEEGMIDADTERVFTAPLEARYRITLANPQDASRASCVEVEVGALDWSAQLNTGDKT